eukprot:3883485-Amphidinium_carterae.1
MQAPRPSDSTHCSAAWFSLLWWQEWFALMECGKPSGLWSAQKTDDEDISRCAQHYPYTRAHMHTETSPEQPQGSTKVADLQFSA